jgi:hypothetical protein
LISVVQLRRQVAAQVERAFGLLSGLRLAAHYPCAPWLVGYVSPLNQGAAIRIKLCLAQVQEAGAFARDLNPSSRLRVWRSTTELVCKLPRLGREAFQYSVVESDPAQVRKALALVLCH